MLLRALAAVLAATTLAGTAAIGAARADPPSLVWERHPGSVSYDVVKALATDRTGAVVVAGNTGGSMAAPAAGIGEIFVLKYSTAGAVLWRRQLGTRQNDDPTGMAIDSSNNIIVVGRTGGWLAGPNHGGFDAFVIKYTPDGVLQWKRPTGGSGDDYPRNVTVDAAGNILFVTATLLIKYTPDGTEAWRRQTPNDRFSWRASATNPDSSFVVAGCDRTSASYDISLAAYAQQGVLQWIRKTATAIDDCPSSIAINASGRIFVVGLEQTEEESKVLLAAFSSTGNPLWRHRFAITEPNTDEGGGVAVDMAGNAIITLQITEPSAKSYSPSGALQWTLPLPRPMGRYLIPAAGGSGNVFIAGAIETGTERWLDGYLAKFSYPSH